MAACDAECRFIFIDVGSPGSDGDVNVFSRSKFGQTIFADNPLMDFPAPTPIDDIDTPYYFVSDDAFPLSNRIMKLYGGSNLSNMAKIYNYHLSRARRTI